ncbi:MAG: sigma-70 family RNA polymerase sigma factor [Planctomycetes bacterium]|nr:sigma-70 family RNA polymerase sigma factor [Planctomycetota bacterium]
MAPRTRLQPQDGVSDDDLLARIGRDRDHDAFTLFFDRHKSAAYNLAQFLVRDPAQAEEAVQEAMLVVWKNASGYESGNARAWLLRIVARRSYRLVEKAQRKRSVITESDDMVRAATARDDTDANEHDELHAALRRSMSDLPMSDRRLLALYYGSGLSQDEIAEELEMPQRTVSDRLKRVLGLLRSRMATAGFAAAAPMLNMEMFNAALTSGEAVPHGLQAGALQSALSSAAKTSARELSRRAAPVGFGTGSAVLAATLIAGGAGAYVLLNQEESSAPQVETAPAPQPVDLAKTPPPVEALETAKAGKAESAGVNRTWDFSKGPDDSLKVLDGSWTWQPQQGRLDAGMAGPLDRFAHIYLPVKLPRQPLKVTLRYQWNVPEKNGRAGAVWGTGEQKGVPGHVPYARKMYLTEVPKRSTGEIYFFDQWVVETVDGAVGSVREFADPYPIDTVIVYFINRVTQGIEVRTITMDEVPAEYRDPKKVIERDGLQPHATDLPPPPDAK